MHPAIEAPPARLKGTPSWLVNQTATHASRLVTDGLAAVGARRYHYSLLAALSEFGPSSQAALGRHTGIDRSDVVAMLNELAEQRLVERAVDPGTAGATSSRSRPPAPSASRSWTSCSPASRTSC